MYEAALKTAVQAYGGDNIMIVSESLMPAEDWYPSIWRVSLLDIVSNLTDIHPFHVWKNMLNKITKRAHFADFFPLQLL